MQRLGNGWPRVRISIQEVHISYRTRNSGISNTRRKHLQHATYSLCESQWTVPVCQSRPQSALISHLRAGRSSGCAWPHSTQHTRHCTSARSQRDLHELLHHRRVSGKRHGWEHVVGKVGVIRHHMQQCVCQPPHSKPLICQCLKVHGWRCCVTPEAKSVHL